MLQARRTSVKPQGLGAPSTQSSSPRRLPRLPAQLPETPPTSRPPTAPPRHWPGAPSLGPAPPGKGRDCGGSRGREGGATTQGRGAERGWGVPTTPRLRGGGGESLPRRPPLPPPAGTPGRAGSMAPGPRGGAGWRGRHEGSGLRHVLRVPHARSVAPAPHVRPTTLATTLAARSSRPAPPRSVVRKTPPTWRRWRPRPSIRLPGRVCSGAGGRVSGATCACPRLRAPPPPPPAGVTRSFCPCASARQWVLGRGGRKEVHFPSIRADAF